MEVVEVVEVMEVMEVMELAFLGVSSTEVPLTSTAFAEVPSVVPPVVLRFDAG
jgi:hypothetical protein